MFDHRHLTRLTSGLLASWLLSLSLASVAVAQDQTPRELPFAPDSELCQADPRSIDELVALTGTPRAGTPDLTAPELATPQGTAADTATVGAITATMIELIACINGREPFRFYSLVSDEFLPELLGGTPLGYESLAQLAEISGTPEAEENWTTLINVRDVQVDGDRVNALVETTFGNREPQVALIYFVEADDRYHIDGIVENVAPSSSGTPTA